ncbi:hypothetical protein D7D52_37230 [Nocardia yunnanensis]|uniref:YbaB/EbfC family DNA-binding protein n=1 Tax=Nocardia yunnanensis TaxID=2382165 RepID=A0A386ZPP9_9NOCA|nr:hypothetical protein [Nocardia yunnanensis]AYF78535.1 hypothetical protein D7D52_37230 [Nocardia yunnanensis]
MSDTSHPLISGAMNLSAEDAELFEIALRTYISTATASDGSISVQVSADGTVHRWQVTETARRIDADQLVGTVIELIGRARNEARDKVHVGFGLRVPDEIPTSVGIIEDKSPSTAAASPTVTTDDNDWDDDEDYYHRGKSRIRAD